MTDPVNAPQSDPFRPTPPPNPDASFGRIESSTPKYSLKLREIDSAQLNPCSRKSLAFLATDTASSFFAIGVLLLHEATISRALLLVKPNLGSSLRRVD